MKSVTRFAPSPTGNLHVGNLRTAIFNFIIARKSGGEFILRLDDTDKERSSQVYADQIKRDLEWLGLEWDRCEKQSERMDQYLTAIQKMRTESHIYECFETTKELELKRKKQLNMGEPPVYDRAALKLTESELTRLRSERPSYWRFRLDHDDVNWTDGILGKVSINTKSISDPVIVRADGLPLYTLASVVDDINFGISHIVRGSDHVTNTAAQVEIIRKLGGSTPVFAHHSLLVGVNGEPLSKRVKDLSLKELKAKGFEAEAVFSFMAQLGSSTSIDNGNTVESVKQNFDLTKFGGNPTKFDLGLLSILSKKHVSNLDFSEISSYLNEIMIPLELQTDFWDMARENISKRSDLKYFWKLCIEGASPVILDEDKEFIAMCSSLVPPYPRSKQSWAEFTSNIKSKTKRSGKRLFLPLRRALTGQERGPDMNKLFPLMQSINF